MKIILAVAMVFLALPLVAQAEDKYAQCLEDLYSKEKVFNEDQMRQTGCNETKCVIITDGEKELAAWTITTPIKYKVVAGGKETEGSFNCSEQK